MSWWFKDQLRSVRIGNQIYKRAFDSLDSINQYIEDGYRLGLKKFSPSSWGSLFHEICKRNRVRKSVDSVLPQYVVGPWEECRAIGQKVENANEYDINSAYGWAGIASVPDTNSALLVRSYRGKQGLYRAIIHRAATPVLPPHLRTNRPVWVSNEEIEQLGLTVAVTLGVEFRRTWEPLKYIGPIIENVKEWKKCLRAYWGAWASQEGPTCKTAAKVWTLPNMYRDVAAAHYIISRVRNKIANEANAALHIFVDAVVTRKHIQTGTGIGDWKLKTPEPMKVVQFEKTGRWSAPNEGIRKHAGTKE